MTELLRTIGVEHPIFLAPLGGGPSTPELAAAVANAGGLGAIAAAYLSPRQISESIRRTRELTDRPLNVNLFAGGYHESVGKDPAPMLEAMAHVHAELGLKAPVLPPIPGDPFDEQFEAVLAAKPRVFSFTFGIPDAKTIERAKSAGILVFGTATTVAEGRLLEAAGVDAVIAQAGEAGGQRGTFDGSFEDGLVPLNELLAGLIKTLEIPVIASGGLMNGRDIAGALNAGASAVQLGTAFLCCPESGASATYKRALLAAGEDRTKITYAFTGRGARGLDNRFMRIMEGRRNEILPFPAQNMLTRELRNAATERGNPEYLSLWAGTGVGKVRAMPASELMKDLLTELNDALVGPVGLEPTTNGL